MTVDSESEAAADLDADADARKTSCADALDFHIESCILRRFAFQYSHFRLCKTETGLVIVTGIIVIVIACSFTPNYSCPIGGGKLWLGGSMLKYLHT